MAEQVGLSARLKFMGDAAVAGMRKAGAQFKKLSFDAKQLKAGMQDIKQGMQGATFAGLAVGTSAGLAVKKFAEFDGQMGAVKAVLGSAQKDSFPALTAEAEKLGATTAFTATQAAEAMENLARAGLEPKQILSGIGPVLDAAAAEGMDLGTAADIVASNLKAFGLEASEAARVADTLAFVSAKTNTDMVGLQEGLKFLGPIAAGMKIPIEDAAASLGVLADVGLKGTLAGTGLKNALIKIANSAKNGAVKVGKFSARVEKTADGGVDLSGTMANIVQKLGNIKDPLKRTQAGMKLLGLRGAGAASAFEALNSEKAEVLFNNLAESAKGSAKEMAGMRLDNLKGDFTLLSSAVDGAINSLGKAMSGTVRDFIGRGGIGGLTGALGEAKKAFEFFSRSPDALNSEIPTQIQGVSKDIMGMVQGFLLGLQDAKKAFAGVFGVVKRVAGVFGVSFEGGANALVRLTTGAAGFALAMAPIGLALKATTGLFGPFVRTGLGAFKVINSGLSSVLGGLGFKKLGKISGSLGKAITGADKMSAKPVRVVNFDEMSGGGLLSGSKSGGPPPVPGSVGAAGLRAGLKNFVGRFGRVGYFLNQSFMGAAKGAVGVKGKLLAMAPQVAKFAAGAAAAGAAGFALGTWIDKKFGLSDKIATGLDRMLNTGNRAAANARVAEHRQALSFIRAREMAQKFVKLQQSGVTSLSMGKGDKRAALTRGLAEARITKFLATQNKSEAEIKEILKGLDMTLSKIGEQSTPNFVLNVDGKTLATVNAKQRVEGKERGVRRATRRTAAIGATP